MGATESVFLNLGGDFAAQASKSASATDSLVAALGRLEPPSALDVINAKLQISQHALKATEKAANAAEKAIEKAFGKAAKRDSNAFDAAQKAFLGEKSQTKMGPTPAKFDFAKNAMGAAVGSIDRVFGQGAALGTASKLLAGAEALKPAMPLLKAGGSALIAGGKVVAGAAAALGVAALGLAIGAGKIVGGIASFGVEQTGMRQRVENAIGKDGYDVGIKVAGKYAIDKEAAFTQVKGLLAAKFASQEVPAIIRVAAGIGEMKGEGKASAFLEKMEASKNKGGKASEETIKGFAEVGINTDKVWAALATKLGMSVDKVKAKVKAGGVSTKDALDAVTQAGGADFGPVADKLGMSIFGLKNKIAIQFAGLFSKFDLKPIEGALGNLSKVLGGPAGEKFGKAMTSLGGAAIKALFGPFQGAAGEKRLTRLIDGLANMAERVVPVIEQLAPYVVKLADALVTLFGVGDAGKGKMDWLAEWAGVLLNLDFGTMVGNIATAIIEGITGIDLSGSAMAAGGSVAAGLAAGIAGGASAAIGAAVALATGVIAAAKGALGVASPSKAFAFLGSMSAEGFAGGANDNAAPAEAGKAMAESAVAGAAGVPGAEGAKGGAGGAGATAKGGAGGGDTYNINIAASDAAKAEEIGVEVRRVLRAIDRERQERAA